MKRSFKRRSSSVSPQVEPDIISAINKMQEQLVYLEKKIDTLINQSSGKSFEGRNFSRPFQRSDESRRHDRGRGDDNFRGRNFTRVICSDCKKECEVPFKPSGDRPVYCQECFAKRRREESFKGGRDNRPREENFFPRPASDRQESEENQGPGGDKRKAASRKRKKRA